MAGSAITSETRLLDADKPEGSWRVVLPRQTDVEYDVSHRGDELFILLRDKQRQNSELLVAPVADPSNTRVDVHGLLFMPSIPTTFRQMECTL
jgi:oligopeptidase B